MKTAIDGKVYLVGAGPGDPGLLTVKARSLIRAAEVILHVLAQRALRASDAHMRHIIRVLV